MKLLDRLIKCLDNKAHKKWPEERPRIEWQEIISQIEPHIENHTIFLEDRDGAMTLLSHYRNNDFDLDIISVAVVYMHDGVEPWDREIPAKHMAEKLKGTCSNHKVGLAMKRDPDSFIGWYVQINA